MKVLITGAAGLVGKILREDLKGRYSLRLFDIKPIAGEGDSVVGDIRDFRSVVEAMREVDAVIHLAIASLGEEYESEEVYNQACVDVNVKGNYNVFEAARQCGVGRVIYASSVRVARGYDYDESVRIDSNTPSKPDSIYGITKYFGEMLGRYYAEEHNLSVICLRIGTPAHLDRTPSLKKTRRITWVSFRDLAQAFRLSLEVKNISFEVLHVISDNPQDKWDISRTKEVLGYRPQDRLE